MRQQAGYWVDADLSTLAKIRAFDAIPLPDRKLPTSVYEMLADACVHSPDKIAIHYFSDAQRCYATGQAVTYGTLWRRINQTANLFHSLGVGPEDVVALLAPVVPQALYTMWGAQAAGIVMPINWMLEPGIIAQLLRAAEAKVLVAYAGDDLVNTWPKVQAVVDLLPALQAVVVISDATSVALPSDLPSSARVIAYEDVIESFDGEGLAFSRNFAGSDTAALFHTGGTTGVPKLARHTHAGQVFMTWSTAVSHRATADDVRCCGLPLFHVSGALLTCLLPIARGSSIVLMTSAGWRHPSAIPNFWDVVETYGITGAMLVPAVVGQLLSVPIGAADISSLTGVSSGSAPLSPHIADSFEALTGIKIREGYGMTETTAVTVVNPLEGCIKTGSVGLPIPYQHVRVVRQQRLDSAAVDCDVDEPGLLLVRGPGLFPGYLDEKANARVLVDGDWLDTGDLAYLDSDGYLWITGRAKDLIIRGGHNIDPRIVEEAIYAHQDVLEAAVVAAPDEKAGEVPFAYISLKPTARSTGEEILAQSVSRIPERAAIPKVCYVLPTLPKTAVGKVQKNVLRADAAERVMSLAIAQAELGPVVGLRVEDRGAAGIVCIVELMLLTDQSHDELSKKVRSVLGAFPIQLLILPSPGA
ncbi:acyl-CoA synthetase [Cupriavidus numazuensis]|uniref:Long-chain-fatty-acid--CoA ligase n=1 Tax=Cupriavidus numazuensis TaxID=221992 RepID=A0ABN7Q5U5_9BURK|nr:acyl-CoA synthetase [Cupriavidus numazuensis]CAG2158210.1 Long-chain-fatty-acid--CoA ligase [Cupriavidus numazuensis]